MTVCAYALLVLGQSWGWRGWVNDVPPAQRDSMGRPYPQVRDGVVLQSTGYTCGAAAVATLLRHTGIDRQATEAAWVPRIGTRRWGGATVLGMAAGLREAAQAEGWRVKILEPDWETFRRLRKPVLCSIRLYPLLHHAVIVCDVDERQGVLVADPLVGMSWWPEARFRERFLSDTIVVFKADPFEPYQSFRQARRTETPMRFEW